jgi:hypothetical protein
MIIHITSQGEIKYIYTEHIDLTSLGNGSIERASNVEPQGLEWKVTMRNGVDLGKFPVRSLALQAEVDYLEKHLGEF